MRNRREVLSLMTAATALPVVGIGGAARALAPDIPTFFELGFERIVMQDWSGFLAPAGTPPDIVATANADINAAVESPKVRDAMATLGMEACTQTPAAFARTVRESWERYRDIVKQSGFQAEHWIAQGDFARRQPFCALAPRRPAASSTRAGSMGRIGSRFAGNLKRFRRVKIKP
jgi:hypothetical protein